MKLSFIKLKGFKIFVGPIGLLQRKETDIKLTLKNRFSTGSDLF